MQDPHCHTSSIEVAVPAATAFEIMADGIKQGDWAWGSFHRKEVEPGIYSGTSVFDGGETLVRLKVNRENFTVDYEVGRTKDKMVFRNHSRVIPGPLVGRDANSCIVSLMSWRLASHTQQQWEQLCTVHEAEMFLIKGLLERKK